jgi:hypothetical protein
MKRIKVAEACVTATFGEDGFVGVAQNKIGVAAVNGADSFFSVAAGDTPLVCNGYAVLFHSDPIAANAAGAEIVVLPRVEYGGVLHPARITADDKYPNVVSVTKNIFPEVSHTSAAQFEFGVISNNFWIAVRNINSVALSTMRIYYNLIQIK